VLQTRVEVITVMSEPEVWSPFGMARAAAQRGEQQMEDPEVLDEDDSGDEFEDEIDSDDPDRHDAEEEEEDETFDPSAEPGKPV
jgi:hypothetical protein